VIFTPELDGVTLKSSDVGVITASKVINELLLMIVPNSVKNDVFAW
jgi:hypothetical protein